MEDIEKTLEERGKTHGNFKDVSETYDRMDTAMQTSGVNIGNLKSTQALALDVIIQKIARIVNGDPDFSDHWEDIAGYSTLIVKELAKPR